MLKIGITGGIGTGKSTVANIFHLLGIPVYNADKRAKYLINHDDKLKKQIRDTFGDSAFHDDSDQLNTQWMADNVFKHDENLKMLNKLVHPRVFDDYESWLKDKQEYPYTLKEAALIFEAGADKQLDKIISVYAPEPVKIERVRQRDPERSLSAIKAIIRQQMPEAKKRKLADYVIFNDESQSVIQQVLETDRLIKETGIQ